MAPADRERSWRRSDQASQTQQEGNSAQPGGRLCLFKTISISGSGTGSERKESPPLNCRSQYWRRCQAPATPIPSPAC
jgi:hypothetical protein